MRGATTVRCFEFEHDLPRLSELEPLVGNGRLRHVPAQSFQLLALMRFTANACVQTESIGLGTMARFTAGLCLYRGQAQHFLSPPRAQADAIAGGCCLKI